jgi:hypothetical protein
MDSDPTKRPRKRGWKFWSFVALNVAGIVIAIPLLKIAIPLVGIWWNTRSQESLRHHEARVNQTRAAASPSHMPAAVPAPSSATNDPLQMLTNQLGTVERMSEKDLNQIVASQFGSTGRSNANPSVFDLDSAVFDSIFRTNVLFQGKSYYAYHINLVDQNGNHKTNIDCFAEPNLEYERCLATMELINRSPQLKRIYQAMAAGLAEKASSQTNSSENSSDGPVLRLSPEALSGER